MTSVFSLQIALLDDFSCVKATFCEPYKVPQYLCKAGMAVIVHHRYS